MSDITIPVNQKTVYYSVAMQMYMSQTIKTPVLLAFDILFNKEASKLDKVKAIRVLWKAFNSLKGLPEPTKENTWHPNTHNLIDLRDWLFERLNFDHRRTTLIRRIMNFVIVLYDFDPPWRWVFDSLKDEALKKEWKARGYYDNWVNTYTWWDGK
jgi:hypothetical protein